MADTTYFSVLNASLGYWQISLDQETANPAHSTAHLVITSSSAFHLAYCPLSLSSAQDIFQKGKQFP